MIDFIAANSGSIVSVLFFTLFVGIFAWTYFPGNKAKIEANSEIPFKGEE